MALDWTPNTNHTGFYIAKANGLYREAGLDVKLISPHIDEYKMTPATRVATKTAHFAVCPTESVISYHTHPGSKPEVSFDITTCHPHRFIINQHSDCDSGLHF